MRPAASYAYTASSVVGAAAASAADCANALLGPASRFGVTGDEGRGDADSDGEGEDEASADTVPAANATARTPTVNDRQRLDMRSPNRSPCIRTAPSPEQQQQTQRAHTARAPRTSRHNLHTTSDAHRVINKRVHEIRQLSATVNTRLTVGHRSPLRPPPTQTRVSAAGRWAVSAIEFV